METEELRFTFEFSEYCSHKYGHVTAFSYKKGTKWQSYSFNEYNAIVNRLALGLLSIGVQKSEFVATIFHYNCPEWNFIDLALSKIGAVHVPIYPTISDSDYLFILNQTKPKYVFVTGQFLYNRLSELRDNLQTIRQIFTIDKLPGVSEWQDILIDDEKEEGKLRKLLEERKATFTEDDIISVVYTSGTTGFPKGVMLSHRNLVSNTLAAASLQPLGLGKRILSFLPLCHVYERTAIYQFQVNGASIYYCESLKSLMDLFKEVKPNGTTVVPRVLEKIIKMVLISGRRKGGIGRFITNWAVQLGFRFKPGKKKSSIYLLWYYLAYFAVFSRVRKSMGDKLEYIGCGGAPIHPKIKRFFWAAKMPVYEGYGLTECAPLVTLNSPVKGAVRSVGAVIPGVEVKLSADNEILCKGPNVTKGYFLQDELTMETIIEGWLHTGDIGKWINGDYLQIVGRKKQMFKTSYGKYIVPQAIESKFNESPLIDWVVVVGEGKHCAAAIISPNFECFKNQFPILNHISNQKLIQKPEVKKAILKEIEGVNRQLGKTEQLKKHIIVADTWTTESGEISPTFKIKRNIILQKYKRQIRDLYSDESIL